MPPQERLPTPLASDPAGKPRFFKRRLFKFLILPVTLIVLLLVVIDITTGGWIRLFGEISYRYFANSNAPTSTINFLSDFNLSATSTSSLGHQTSLATLGIAIPQQPGNGAEDFLNYFGYYAAEPAYHNVSGTWDIIYGGIDEAKINLGPQDEQFLAAVASKQDFSFFPDRFPIPKTPLTTAPITMSPTSILRFTRRIIVLANTYGSASNTKKEGVLLQSLLIWGRKMEEAKDGNLLEWLVGKRIEETVLPALISFYEKQGDVNRKNAILQYQQEISDLKQKVSTWSSLIPNFVGANTALAHLRDKELGNPVAVYTEIKFFMTTDDYKFVLNVFNTDEPVIQNEGLRSGISLLRIHGPEPEHSIAMQILQRYQHSTSPVIRVWANYLLATDPRQIIQDVGQSTP